MLKKTIRPEFLNRIDETIMFLPLTEPEIKQIVVLQIKGVQKMLSGNGVELVLTNAAIDFLANAGYDPEFGKEVYGGVCQNKFHAGALLHTLDLEHHNLLDSLCQWQRL